MKRVFLLDSRRERLKALNALIASALHQLDLKRGRDIQIDIGSDFLVVRENLPADYDLYLLHPRDTSEEAVQRIKETQEWSSIMALGGGWNESYVPEEEISYRKLFHRTLPLASTEDFVSIFYALTMNQSPNR